VIISDKDIDEIETPIHGRGSRETEGKEISVASRKTEKG
jgi:hypothetical protein